MHFFPKERNFNTGIYRDLGNVIATCATLHEPNRIEVTVEVGYLNAVTLIPYAWKVTLEDRNCWFWNCDHTAYFSNQPYGGANGLGELLEAIEWLASTGCGMDEMCVVVEGTGLLQC